ncbi:hypothetical protein DFQ27_007747 [Actinomortierella ambigua]|uniref:Uncharacterized protein n=1 Tax=Actinomortierella ambigua TaxID=1343610 RepID=A0A9P6PS77_9FUNG|nr:hypothetical protein DFQ27_007747 [Actinomortierella ambigua]
MKVSFVALCSLVAPLTVLAAPTTTITTQAAGNSTCIVLGFKMNTDKVTQCCQTNLGSSVLKRKQLPMCTLPIGSEGPYRKCVADLNYPAWVICWYN